MAKENEGQIEEVGLADKRVDIQTYDRYKGRKGVTDRLAIISMTLLRSYCHYHKRTFKCLSTEGHEAICCQNVGPPDQKFGLVVFQYTTDEDGNLVDDQKCSGKVKLWIVSETRYAELSQLHNQFPLIDSGFGEDQVDFLAKCTEEQYQRMTFTPTRSSHWKSKQKWYDALHKMSLKAKVRLQRAMGADLSELEIADLLDVTPPGGATTPFSDDDDLDMDDILDQD